MKICIIGNSHLGAIKRAWDNIENDFPQIQLIFFAQRGRGLDHLIIRNAKLIPDNESLAKALEHSSNGKEEVDTDEYDLFIIYGVGAKAFFSIENKFFSKTVLAKSMEDLVTNTLSYKLIKQLRQLTDKAIFIGHNPLRTRKKKLSSEHPTDYLNGLKVINQAIYKPLNAQLVEQPIATIVNGRATHPSYSQGSKRLATGDSRDNKDHPEEDNGHMNDKFGELWLTEFFKKFVS